MVTTVFVVFCYFTGFHQDKEKVLKPTPDMDWLEAGEPIQGGPARGADGSIHVVSICHGRYCRAVFSPGLVAKGYVRPPCIRCGSYPPIRRRPQRYGVEVIRRFAVLSVAKAAYGNNGLKKMLCKKQQTV